MPPPKVVISAVRFEVPPGLENDPHSRRIVNEYSNGEIREFGTQGPPLLDWLSTMINCPNDELPKRFVLDAPQAKASVEPTEPPGASEVEEVSEPLEASEVFEPLEPEDANDPAEEELDDAVRQEG